MAYGEVSAGVGLGIKTFDLIFVFDDAQAMTSFINKGWEYTGEATAAAKHGDQGAARTEAHSVSPGVRVYQLTSTGLAAELTIKGTRYFKDPKLNQ
jgi:lipid-binding SYLF domain-containing protein